MSSRWARALVFFVALAIQACSGPGNAASEIEQIKLPDGFRIEVFVDDVPNARQMTLGDKTLFIGSRHASNVYAVPIDWTDSGPSAGSTVRLARGLNTPHGVAYKDGDLFVAELTRVLRFPGVEDRLDDADFEVVYDEYPTGHHGWKYIDFGPDGMLYVPVGVPCNVCIVPGHGLITRINPDGTGREDIAFGVRNSVGLAWHPDTKELWFTDNGRDHLGDDIPSCELNVLSETGMHFGFPYCHGGDTLDPEYGDGRSCDEFTSPVLQLGPHVAPLGLTFYSGDMFPDEYEGQLFIALHGSWNRSVPIGYELMRVKLDGSTPVAYEPFAEGWLQSGDAWGRPVDVIVLPDGSMLVSDDKLGVIYRITYSG